MVKLSEVVVDGHHIRPKHYTGDWVNIRADELVYSVGSLMLTAESAKNNKERRRFTKLAYSKARACLYWFFWHRVNGTDVVRSEHVIQVLKYALQLDTKSANKVASEIAKNADQARLIRPLESMLATKHRAFRALKVKKNEQQSTR